MNFKAMHNAKAAEGAARTVEGTDQSAAVPRKHCGRGSSRSRRGLLAGAAGALGVVAAKALANPAPAQAADGQPVLQGTDNGPASARTLIMTTGFAEFASLADSSASNGKGSVGVWGHGADNGVMGESVSGGTGVLGLGGANGGTGVVGNGGGQAGSGVVGTSGSAGGTGVIGTSGGGNGTGVLGTGSGTGNGVHGIALKGNGVHGSAGTGGIGVLAENTSGGAALTVTGPASFSRSGVLTVPAGHATATQSGVALSTASLVLVTLQQHATGLYVLAAVPNSAGHSFKVYLSKSVSASTKVAWFVVN